MRRSPDAVQKLFVLPHLAEEFSAATRPNTASRAELDALCGGGNHQGVAALLGPTRTPSLDELIDSPSGSRLIVVLDQVEDPQNLGAVLRAAEVWGAQAVLATERRSAPLTPAARKSSVGASEIIPLIRVTNLQRALEKLKAAGVWVVGTEIGAEREIYGYRFPRDVALVLGSEGRGLRALTRSTCDELLRLPMYGVLQSLNVAQTASVFLYEVQRQRHEAR